MGFICIFSLLAGFVEYVSMVFENPEFKILIAKIIYQREARMIDWKNTAANFGVCTVVRSFFK